MACMALGHTLCRCTLVELCRDPTLLLALSTFACMRLLHILACTLV